MKVIIISGTPGTGKTKLAKIIEKLLNFKRLDVNSTIDQYSLCDEYDEARQCKIVDIEKLNPLLIKKIQQSKQDIVIDSHLSHHLPPKYVNLCIITKCNLKVLQKRLRERDYTEPKLRENLDAEIFDTCLVEAEELGHNILIVDTSHDIDEEELIEKIKERIR